MFDWSVLASSNWPIKLQYFSLPEHSDRVYTPWYALADGSVCNCNSPNAAPQSLASVACNQALIAYHQVQGALAGQSVLVVPAYRLNPDTILLLDGNHRAAASQVAASRVAIAAFVVNGPIDGGVLPDLVHWA